MSQLSIVIPIYNEEKNIERTIRTIRESLADKKIEYEIIAVNDGSTDRSLETLKGIRDIKLIANKTNKGYGYSLKKGLRHASFDHVCIIDADMTYPAAEIPTMFAVYLNDKLDMLVGARTGKNVSYPWLKKIPKYFLNALANYVSSTKIPDLNSGLRIFNKSIALKYVHLYPNGFSFTTTITLCMLCGDYEVDYIPIDYYKREGKSKIKPIADTMNFFKLLLRISLYFNPFKFFTPIIFVFSIASVVIFLLDIIYLRGLTKGAILFPVLTLLFFTLGLLADLVIKRTH